MNEGFVYWPGTRWRWICRFIGHKGVLVTDLDAWVLYCRRCGNELGRGDSPEDLLYEEYDPRLRRRLTKCPTCGGTDPEGGAVAIAGPDEFGNYDTDDCPDPFHGGTE